MSETPSTVIADADINGRDVLRCELGEFNGRKTFALRKWFKAADGSIKPTPKGLTIALAHLPWIAKATADALARALAEGLLDEEVGR